MIHRECKEEVEYCDNSCGDPDCEYCYYYWWCPECEEMLDWEDLEEGGDE